jgi:hypothetical protein
LIVCPSHSMTLRLITAQNSLPPVTKSQRGRCHRKPFQTKSLNETFRDFPVLCPSKEENEQFLAYFLQIESQLLPRFHESPWGGKCKRQSLEKCQQEIVGSILKRCCSKNTGNHFLATYQSPLGSFKQELPRIGLRRSSS